MVELYINGCNLSGKLSTEISENVGVHCAYGFDGVEYILIPIPMKFEVEDYVRSSRKDISLTERYEVNGGLIAYDVRCVEE